jgi:cysteinyl-tRNA synthetase
MDKEHYPWTQPAGASHPRLVVANSLTGTKTPFVPRGGGNVVKLYICGPTVYDSSHLGHAATYVRLDVVCRLLSDYFNYDVVLQMNVTDVDDKIIMRASERGIGFDELSREFEQEFLEDMESLNVRPADYLTRVTEFIPDVVAYIETIISNGFAYERDGSVYFDTASFTNSGHNYGKLEPWSIGNKELIAEGEGKLTAGDAALKQAKKSSGDFVLWKASKPKEPTWPSPWGPGRPGWHIECSAMASSVLGDEIDIHGGGVDLRFPHHSNELAQAEAYHNCDQWVNYFLHTGHLHIDGLKMSKSLKNFTTIRETLTRYNSRQLRLLFLGHRYDAPMNYAEKNMQEAVSLDRSFIDFFGNVKAALREASKNNVRKICKRPGDIELALLKELEHRQAAIHNALADNLDTQRALQELVHLVSTTNSYIAFVASVNVSALSSVGRYVSKMFRVFGVTSDGQEIGYGGGGTSGEGDVDSREAAVGPLLDAFAAYRDSVRKISRTDQTKAGKYLLELSDAMRDDVLPPLGVRLEDRGEGESAKWILEDSASLMLEIERKRKGEAEKSAIKAALKATRLAKEEEELEKGHVAPGDMFKIGEYAGKYSAYDNRGVPMTDAFGAELAKAARKKLEKERTRQEKAHAKFEQALAMGRLTIDGK